MNKKRKRLKTKTTVILLLLSLIVVFVGFGFFMNPQKGEGEDKQPSLASKTVAKKDRLGKCNYVLMDTGDVNQIKIGAYQGCETVSLYNALVYLNKTHDKSVKEVLDSLPLVGWDGNPNLGYAGDPWTPDDQIPDGGFPTIWPDAFMKFAQSYGANVVDISGKSIDDIKNIVLKKHLVEMWVTIDFAQPQITYTDYFGHEVVTNTHAVILDGYDAKKKEFHVNDPIKGKYWLPESTVSSVYMGTNQFAVEFVS